MALDISKIKDRDTANAFDAALNIAGVQLGILLEAANDTVTAAGATQATATLLTAALNRVTTATANQGVALPVSKAGMDIFVMNNTAVPMIVYGQGTDTVDGSTNTVGVVQMPKSVVLYTCYTAGAWFTNGLGTGFAANLQGGSSLETVQFTDAISAAGSTQAGGTQLTSALNTVATATANQGVNLPASSPGLMVAVQNTSGNTIIVYPAQGASDTINGVAATTGVSLLPGSVAVFNCTAAGAWNTLPATAVMDALNTAANTTGFTTTSAQVTGGQASVVLALTGALGAGANITTPTATAWIAALHCPSLGTTYRLRIINESSGAFSWTVVAGSGVTLTGTATIAQNTWREYDVKVTNVGAPAITISNVGTGTFS